MMVQGRDIGTMEGAVTGMSFSLALVLMKGRQLMRRSAWSTTGRFLVLVPAMEYPVDGPPWNWVVPDGFMVRTAARIDEKTADGVFRPWMAEHGDLLAEDWETLSTE